ncbi:hypothetical protein B0J13DRAFT_243437 [Dactylonectria estremocensis]|uniref:Ubiquitin 3 binding protein But2 C-terminal domain-containing protein n=1 Tax=Dactylonectria estremocensis TaxID=1079267 RepID=A0A9P9D6A0_9HYPO|nr:hypothetical protein B0J13DRAFT_243437 [Dactylonectria estremocensis]
MPSFTNILSSLACLMVVTNAAPTNNVARQHLSDRTVSTPSQNSDSRSTRSECPTGSEAAQLIPSAIYDVFPNHPDLAKDPVNGVHLETYNNASQVEQVLVFKGIPTSAKECSLGWQQGERIERVFVVKGSDALSEARLMTGFPAEGEKVTYKSTQPFVSGNTFAGIDFTNWDDLDVELHIGGGFACAETVYIKVNLRNKDGNSKVYLNQDENNGYYVSYSC